MWHFLRMFCNIIEIWNSKLANIYKEMYGMGGRASTYKSPGIHFYVKIGKLGIPYTVDPMHLQENRMKFGIFIKCCMKNWAVRIISWLNKNIRKAWSRLYGPHVGTVKRCSESWYATALDVFVCTYMHMYGLLTKCEVKMAGYWPSSFLRVYGPRRSQGP